MSAGTYDFTVERGTATNFSVLLADKYGTARVLTNCTPTAEIRLAHGQPLVASLTCSVVAPAATSGRINCSLSAADSLKLAAGVKYKWDLFIKPSGSAPTRELKGTITVEGNITKVALS